MNNPVKPTACEILDIIQETPNQQTFRIKNTFPIKHGQFMELSIPKIGEAPISVSDFGDGYADFTIRKVGKFTDGLFAMKKGDTLFVRGCYGNGWPVDKFKGKNIVIVAGGTGVAAVKSLIKMFAAKPNFAKDIYLICGFKNISSVLFADDLKKWKAAPNFHTTFALDNETAPGFKEGLVTTFVKDIPFASFADNYECIVIGPPVMMHFTSQELLKNNVHEDKIWLSFERKMSCGIGKCGHCRIDETYVCLDGPIFNYTAGKKLID